MSPISLAGNAGTSYSKSSAHSSTLETEIDSETEREGQYKSKSGNSLIQSLHPLPNPHSYSQPGQPGHPGRPYWPANRPSSALDLTDLPNTPPMPSVELHPHEQEHEEGGHVVHMKSKAAKKRVNGNHNVVDLGDLEHGSGMEVDSKVHDEQVGGLDQMAILLKTIDFAATKHSCQRRKDVDQTPYINHPIAVANFLSSTGIKDIRVLQAAVLHDTVEDTHTSIEEIAAMFGDEVARIVEECTDNPNLSGQQRKDEQVRSARHKSKEAQQVKLADKLHNLESIRRSPPVGWGVRRVQAYFIWAKQVTDICAPSHPALAGRLQRLYETAYTKINGAFHPCHPEVCGPLTEAEKDRIDSRLNYLKAGEAPCPKPIFF